MPADFAYDQTITTASSVSNLEKAIAWYGEHLGFDVLFKVEEMGWCEMKSPVNGVSLGLSQVEKPETKGGATIVFGVTDIDAARAALEGKGVKFDGETMTIPDMVRLATFYDPDGNKLMFSQSLMQQ